MDSAVQEVLAALKANPLSKDPPRWAPFDEYTCAFIRNPYGGHVAQFRTDTERDYALAVVNAALVLVAEVERLQGLLAAVREAVAALPEYYHEASCGIECGHKDCDCPAEYGETKRTAARRYFAAVGE